MIRKIPIFRDLLFRKLFLLDFNNISNLMLITNQS